MERKYRHSLSISRLLLQVSRSLSIHPISRSQETPLSLAPVNPLNSRYHRQRCPTLLLQLVQQLPGVASSLGSANNGQLMVSIFMIVLSSPQVPLPPSHSLILPVEPVLKSILHLPQRLSTFHLNPYHPDQCHLQPSRRMLYFPQAQVTKKRPFNNCLTLLVTLEFRKMPWIKSSRDHPQIRLAPQHGLRSQGALRLPTDGRASVQPHNHLRYLRGDPVSIQHHHNLRPRSGN